MLPKLDDVTLLCIDTDHPAAGLHAVQLSQAQCQFGRTIFITSSEFVSQHAPPHPQTEFRTLHPPVETLTQAEIMMKRLVEFVSTSHVLIIQWDGYVLDGRRWSSDFLQFDYIGAVWPTGTPGLRVGNGGFSLRSRRLLEVLARPEMTCSDPEDNAICVRLRPELEKHGIKFADEQTASRFSFEALGADNPTFGFHGIFNFCRVVSPADLQFLLDQMPPRVLSCTSVPDLIKGYALRNRWREAEMVLRKLESQFDEQKVLEILSEIADHNLEHAKAAQAVIHAKAKQ